MHDPSWYACNPAVDLSCFIAIIFSPDKMTWFLLFASCSIRQNHYNKIGTTASGPSAEIEFIFSSSNVQEDFKAIFQTHGGLFFFLIQSDKERCNSCVSHSHFVFLSWGTFLPACVYSAFCLRNVQFCSAVRGPCVP